MLANTQLAPTTAAMPQGMLPMGMADSAALLGNMGMGGALGRAGDATAVVRDPNTPNPEPYTLIWRSIIRNPEHQTQVFESWTTRKTSMHAEWLHTPAIRYPCSASEQQSLLSLPCLLKLIHDDDHDDDGARRPPPLLLGVEVWTRPPRGGGRRAPLGSRLMETRPPPLLGRLMPGP